MSNVAKMTNVQPVSVVVLIISVMNVQLTLIVLKVYVTKVANALFVQKIQIVVLVSAVEKTKPVTNALKIPIALMVCVPRAAFVLPVWKMTTVVKTKVVVTTAACHSYHRQGVPVMLPRFIPSGPRFKAAPQTFRVLTPRT